MQNRGNFQQVHIVTLKFSELVFKTSSYTGVQLNSIIGPFLMVWRVLAEIRWLHLVSWWASLTMGYRSQDLWKRQDQLACVGTLLLKRVAILSAVHLSLAIEHFFYSNKFPSNCLKISLEKRIYCFQQKSQVRWPLPQLDLKKSALYATSRIPPRLALRANLTIPS